MNQHRNVVKLTWLALLSLPMLVSCSFFEKEDPLARERAELKSEVDSFFAIYWRAAKISARSLPVTGNESGLDFEALQSETNQKFKFGTNLSKIYNYVNASVIAGDKTIERPTFTTSGYLQIAKEILSLKETVINTDEDQFPTLMEVVARTHKALKIEMAPIPENWSSAYEHWVFALIMESRLSPGAWKTYELDKLNPRELDKTDYQVLAAAHKSINLIRNGWNFLAIENTTDALEILDGKIELSNDFNSIYLNLDTMSNEKSFVIQMRAILKLMRGFARFKTEDEELEVVALQDLSEALDDFNQLGLNNELTWMTSLFVYIKQGKSDEAIETIDRLKASPYISAKERQLLENTKTALKNRDPESAFNIVTDKISMSQIGYQYAQSRFSDVEWKRLIERTELGKKLINLFPELTKNYEKAKKYLTAEKLKAEGKALFDNLSK